MKTFTIVLLCAAAAVSSGPVMGSQATDWWAANLGPQALFPLTGSGSIFPSDWVVGAGEVVAYSPDLQEGADPAGGSTARYPKPDSWVTVVVAKPIAGTKPGDSLTVYFRQPYVAGGGAPTRWHLFTDIARLVGGERLLVEARDRAGALRPLQDLFPLRTYDDDSVRALQEYARWDTLAGPAQSEAIARAVCQTSNRILAENAPRIFAMRSAANRAAALRVLVAIARDKNLAWGSDGRVNALLSANVLYRTDEVGGVSGDILALYEELLHDATLTANARLNIVANLRNRGLGSAVDSKGKQIHYYRPRVLQIIERFIAKTTDPDLKKAAEQERAVLLDYARTAARTVAD